MSIFGNLLGNSVEGSLVGIAGHTASSSKEGYVSIFGNVGFGSHKSFCHVRGPDSVRNVSIQNNVSLQKAENLDTEGNTQFSGISVDAAKVQNVSIKNNEFYDYSGHGVRVDSDASNVTIQHNTFTRPKLAGVRFVGGSDSIIDGNLVTNAGEAGIRLKGTTDTVIHGNSVRESGTAGIIAVGRQSSSGNDIVDNYIKNNNKKDSQTSPAIFIQNSGLRVRGNSVRQNGAPAIVEHESVGANLYEDNWADGDQPWRFASPTSRTRGNDPPTDAHRGVTSNSGEETVRTDFDQTYARPPRLTFGRNGGGIRDISYGTDGDGNFVGAEL